MSHETKAFLIAAGLVVVALCGLVVVWKLTKSFLKLAFWLGVLLLLAVGGPGGCWLNMESFRPRTCSFERS